MLTRSIAAHSAGKTHLFTIQVSNVHARGTVRARYAVDNIINHHTFWPPRVRVGACVRARARVCVCVCARACVRACVRAGKKRTCHADSCEIAQCHDRGAECSLVSQGVSGSPIRGTGHRL